MSDEYIDAVIEVSSLESNLNSLLACRERMQSILTNIRASDDSSNVKMYEKSLNLLDTTIALEAQVIYIDSLKVCLPIIEKYNRDSNKPREVRDNIVELK